jgi:hypothetical protein
MWVLAERLDELKAEWRKEEGGPYGARCYERFMGLLDDNWETVLLGLRAIPGGPGQSVN